MSLIWHRDPCNKPRLIETWDITMEYDYKQAIGHLGGQTTICHFYTTASTHSLLLQWHPSPTTIHCITGISTFTWTSSKDASSSTYRRDWKLGTSPHQESHWTRKSTGSSWHWGPAYWKPWGSWWMDHPTPKTRGLGASGTEDVVWLSAASGGQGMSISAIIGPPERVRHSDLLELG